ncbi:hypothetical protein M422DRAFT_199235 [Sphaerobolus stellatus SS14]|nr:hypothetical protein M422DRAFT_199235 [Sphaerobolus stellatus SS14]
MAGPRFQDGQLDADGFENPWKDDHNPYGYSNRATHSGHLHADSPSFHDSTTPESEHTEFEELIELEKSSEPQVKYEDGSSIDWIQEDAKERLRIFKLSSLRGLRGLLLPWWDVTRVWIVLIGTGVGVGIIGGWLDVLVQWLSDLREGRCAYGFFYNQVACCSGLDPGEVCQPWMTWSQWFGLRYIFAQSLLQASVYVGLAVIFAASAGILVKSYAPFAFHTGIPEIKAIVGGYVLDEFLGPWTLLIKGIGLVLSVASGLSLGKEGPLVHLSCAMAYVLSGMFESLRGNETRKRKLLAAAAAAGVAVAFGSPLGGVLFGLEELDTFSDENVVWRAFVTSAIAAVALQYVDPFGTSKLVLFQVTANTEPWKAFELIPWLMLGVIGGVLGAFMIRLNVNMAVIRRNSVLAEWPLMEIIAVTGITAGLSYLVIFARVQTSNLVANLFLECDPLKGDWHGLCNPNANIQNIFLLLLTAALKVGLTAYTFGLKLPAGIFLPTIAIGASLGRAVGIIVQALYHAYPTAWIFSACPPDPSEECIFPGFYAVIGASALLGGVTRMTLSLVVILFELTGALSHVLPIMLVVMVSKWVGDAFGKEGIYEAWMKLRNHPWLPPIDHRDHGASGASLMTPVEKLVTVRSIGLTIEDLDTLVKTYDYYGFPVVDGETLVGFVTRDKLLMAISPFAIELGNLNATCTFIRNPEIPYDIDFSFILERAPMEFRPQMAQELLVNIFQKLNLRYALFSQEGKLRGLITKRDVVRLLMRHYKNTPSGALARDGKGVDQEWDVNW